MRRFFRYHLLLWLIPIDIAIMLLGRYMPEYDEGTLAYIWFVISYVLLLPFQFSSLVLSPLGLTGTIQTTLNLLLGSLVIVLLDFLLYLRQKPRES